MTKPKRARDFGDDPKIRRSHGEGDFTPFDIREPWERRYRGIGKAKATVKAHTRKVNGKTIRVKGHVRVMKKTPKYVKSPQYKKHKRR